MPLPENDVFHRLHEQLSELLDGDRKHADAYEAVKEQLSRIQRDVAAERAFSATDDLHRIMQLLEQELSGLGHFDGFLVNLRDERGEHLITRHIRLPSEFAGIEDSFRGFSYSLDNEQASQKAFRTGQPVRLKAEDVRRYEGSTQTRFGRWTMSELAILPLHEEAGSDAPLGTVWLFVTEGELAEALLAQAQVLLETLSPHLRRALNVHLVREQRDAVNDAHDELEDFIGFVTDVNSLTTQRYVFERISEELLARFDFNFCTLLLKREDGLHLVHSRFDEAFASRETDWEDFRRDTIYSLDTADGASAMVLAQNKHLLVEDTLKIMHLPMSGKDHAGLTLLRTPRTFLLMPIRCKGEAIGVLWLINLEQPIRLEKKQLRLIEMLASFVGSAIRNAGTYELVEKQRDEIGQLNSQLENKIDQLDQLVKTDRLTGLYNFGYFEEELRRRISEYQRRKGQATFSIILLDIDHFKQLNDRHGHVAGNKVLGEIAARLTQYAREMDVVARYGGEEFVIILPQSDIDGARSLADRIRKSLHQTPFDLDGELIAITSSFGCTVYVPGDTVETMSKRADEALYRAKHEGRDRVEVLMGSGEDSP